MLTINPSLLQRANEEAIYILYLYLAHKSIPIEQEAFSSVLHALDAAAKSPVARGWTAKDLYRLKVLKNALQNMPSLKAAEIHDLTYSKSGLTACAFTKPDGSVSVVFKGTGSGEWIDNGEGLSGIPEENIYLTYQENGQILRREVVAKDYATDQQVQARNWFFRIAAKNNWSKNTPITLSGHSKGGNKAQFVTIHSDMVDTCFSFDGQGFSPEALAALKRQYADAFEERQRRIYSLSADNDYVNVLGARLMPPDHIYYFSTHGGIHPLEYILDEKGALRPQKEQGKLSAYAEGVSDTLMGMPPWVRQYATLGMMNVLQRHFGEGVPVNGDAVSVEKTVAGVTLSLGAFLHQLGKRKK